MTLPVRTPFHVATDYGDIEPQDYTLRQAMEYYKRGIECVIKYQPPSPLEQRLVDEAWVALVAEIAEREGILPGPLSYFLGEYALSERNLQAVAEDELMTAVSYRKDGPDEDEQ